MAADASAKVAPTAQEFRAVAELERDAVAGPVASRAVARGEGPGLVETFRVAEPRRMEKWLAAMTARRALERRVDGFHLRILGRR